MVACVIGGSDPYEEIRYGFCYGTAGLELSLTSAHAGTDFRRVLTYINMH